MDLRLVGFRLFALLLSLGASICWSQENPTACAAAAAAAGYPGFVALVSDASLPDYGFANRAEAQQATPGGAIRLDEILPSALAKYASGDAIEGLLSATSEWYVPIMANRELRAILIVQQSGPTCSAVSLGLARLATRLRETGFDPAAGQRLVVVRQAREFFVVDADAGSLRSLRPTASGVRLAAEAPDAVVLRLKPVVEENIRERGAP